jgi:hypothetical protein
LVDAVIVIKAHELEVWPDICANYEIVVPGIAKGEAHLYFRSDHCQGFSIELSQIKEWEASSEEMKNIYSNFDRAFKGSIHDGEVECLAFLKAHLEEDIRFCTADGPAITALAMLGMTERGVSFEEALRLIGRTKTFSRKDHHFTERFFQDRIDRGREKRIRGEGLSETPHHDL